MDDRRTNSLAPVGLLLAAVALWLAFSGKTDPVPLPPGPSPDPTALADFVRVQAARVSGSTTADEAAALAANYAEVAAEIETLGDPLSSSTLKRPADAIARVAVANQNTLGARATAWMPFFDALTVRFEELDRAGRIERSIYAVGEVYAQVAAGLQALPRGPPDSTAATIISAAFADEGTEDFDPEAAYTAGAIGAFIDEPGLPDSVRAAAREGDEQFDAAGGQDVSAAFPRSFMGTGAGKRAVYWNYACRFDNDPLPVFAIKQITGNCVEASNGDVTLTHLMGVSIFLLRQPYEWEGPGSTLFYARRGHCGKGMNLGTAAALHLEDGAAWRKVYLNGKYDLRDTLVDQRLSMNTCRDPKRSLADLWIETRKTPVGQVARFTGSVDDAMDILYAGGALQTGSTASANRDGDPISSRGKVGSHAQTCIGYDDSEEFRAWHKQVTGRALTEPVFIFDQTWGDVPYVKKNWPQHLWGRETPGMFVLRWSDAKYLIGSTCYAYWPDLRGVTPAKLQWRLDNARTMRTDRTGDRQLALAL
jgi:hypothetical protein